MFKGRVRAPTYDELEEELLNPKLIVMNRPIKIPRLGFIQNIDDVDFNDFDLNNHNLKTMIEARNESRVLHDKETQKDYELQNHDLFPEMYEEIDATGSDMGNDEKRTQTKRFTPKGFDIYSSANSSSGKPSSPPSPHHISRPTSSESSEQEAPKKKGFGFFNSREWDMYRRLGNNENRNSTTQQSSSSSGASSSSALPSNVRRLTQEQMARSRSHSSQSSGSGKKK